MTASNPLPGQQEQPEEILCPHCGRFVGPMERCPHCGAKLPKRLSVRFFRWAALFLAVVGVGLLWLMATRGDVPVIEIGNIQRTMNFAFVKVEGRVMGDARIYEEAGRVSGLRFTVDDGTGELDIQAYRAKARELIEADKIPQAGDRVEVAGSLSVSADRLGMWLSSPDQIQIERYRPELMALAALSKDLVGAQAMVAGVVQEVGSPKLGSRAPWRVVLTDGTDRTELVVWQNIFDELSERIQLQEGRVIRADVTVDTYREDLQLMVGDPGDVWEQEMTPRELFLQQLEGPAEGSVSLADITPARAGEMVRVRGRIVRLDLPEGPSRAYRRITLEEEGRELELVYEEPAARSAPEDDLAIGRRLDVIGRVETVGDRARLRLYHGKQMQILEE